MSSSGVAFDAVMDLLRLGQNNESPIPAKFIERIEVDRELGITLKLNQHADAAAYNPFEMNNKVSVTRLRVVKLGYNNYMLKYERLKQILIYLKEHYNELFLSKGKEKEFFKIDSIDLNNLNRVVINCDQLSVISDSPFTTDH